MEIKKEHILNLLDFTANFKGKFQEIEFSQYNLFEVLNIAEKEVIHTFFIADLLNPFGAHGCGNIFLKLFLQISGLEIFCEGRFKTYAEYSLGKTDNNRISGGYIDILLMDEDKKTAILIENKLYARDQEKQLERYYNTLKDHKKIENVIIIYLTPQGRFPSKNSLGNLNIEFVKCLSYTKHIKNWIRECLDSIEKTRPIRTHLIQYHEFVQYRLKSIFIMESHENFISELDIQDENIVKSVLFIHDSISALKNRLLLKLIQDVEELFAIDPFLKVSGIVEEDNYFNLNFTSSRGINLEYGLEKGVFSVGISRNNRHDSFDYKEKEKVNVIYERLKRGLKPNPNFYNQYLWIDTKIELTNFHESSSFWIQISNKQYAMKIKNSIKEIYEIIHDCFE